MQEENAELQSDVKALKIQANKQDQEIVLLKNHISNIETEHSFKCVSSNTTTDSRSSEYDNGPSPRALNSPPSSCQEWWDSSPVKLPNGIYLMKNNKTNQINAVHCQFLNGNPSKKHIHNYIHNHSDHIVSNSL